MRMRMSILVRRHCKAHPHELIRATLAAPLRAQRTRAIRAVAVAVTVAAQLVAGTRTKLVSSSTIVVLPRTRRREDACERHARAAVRAVVFFGCR